MINTRKKTSIMNIKDGKNMNYTVEKANQYIEENENLINLKHRHVFHLMPKVGWMNDPNGFIFYKGYYHLFFQFYPYEPKWGPMHWGHARSKDLLKWEHLPVALAPDLPNENGCFSGGSVVVGEKLYLMYTAHYHQAYQKQEQSLAISTDGIYFEKGSGKPIITIDDLPADASKFDFRDPNPVSIRGKQFVLVGSSTIDKNGQILVYETDDYKTFKYLSSIKHPLFGEIAECPDLFELDGKDVLLFSATNLKTENNRFRNINSSLYATGHFDINTGTFIFEHIDEIDGGHHYYAPQTLLTPLKNRVAIAWMEMWGKPYYTDLSGHGWVGAMSLPRTLKVLGNKLIQAPLLVDDLLTVEKISNIEDVVKPVLINKHFHLNLTCLTDHKTSIHFGSKDNYFELLIDFELITLDTSKTTLFPLEMRSLKHSQKTVVIDLIMDNSSLELFVSDHDKTLTTRVYFDEAHLSLEIKQGLDQIQNINLKELDV